MSEVWIEVQGEIVGYLHQLDDDTDHDTMIVRVAQWRHVGNQIWQLPRMELPVCVLRWIGNDNSLIGRGTVARKDDDDRLLGDIIRFTTNAEEQQHYAMWN